MRFSTAVDVMARPFWDVFTRFEFEFCQRGNYFKKNQFDSIHCDCTFTCAVACIPTVVVSLMVHDNMYV